MEQLKLLIMGDKIKNIDYISELALEKNLTYPDAFRNGLMLNNLPSGFHLHIDGESIKRIYYDPSYNVSGDSTPLTASLKAQRNQFFTICSFNCFIPENIEVIQEKRTELEKATNQLFGLSSIELDYQPNHQNTEKILNFYKTIIQISEPDNFAEFEKNYDPILKKLNYVHLLCMRPILSEYGVKKFRDFLDTLLALQKKGLFESFQKAFIDKQKNLINFINHENEYNSIIQYLLGLPNNQIEWWNNLIIQQAESCEHSDLFSMKAAFEYFVTELNKLAPGVPLPQPCLITNAKNLHVTLDRLLYILKNAADVKEQLYNLKGISLDPEGAFYAVSKEDFYFVSKEMELENDKPTKKKRFTYRVDIKTLVKKAQTIDDNSFNKIYYRYLGAQQYILPFDYYRDLLKKITESQKLVPAEKNQLLAIVAFSTTGNKALSILPTEHLKKLLKILDEMPEERRSVLLNIFMWIIETGAQITIEDVATIAKFYQHQADSFTEEDFQKYLKIDVTQPDAVVHSFILLAQRNEEHRINWKDFSSKIDSIRNVIALQFSVLIKKENFNGYDFDTLKIDKSNFKNFFSACQHINAELTTEFLDQKSLNIIQQELIKKQNLSEKQIREILREHAPSIAWKVENLAVMAQQSTEDLIELVKSEAFSSAYEQFKSQIKNLPEKEQLVTMISQKAYTLENFLGNIIENIPSELITSFITSRLFGVCELYLGGLLHDSVMESSQKRLLLQALYGYMRSDKNEFFDNFKRAKEFIQTYNKQNKREQQKLYLFLKL